MNTVGIYSGNYIITNTATYGPGIGRTTLNGNLNVNSNANLQNLTVNGTIFVNPGENGHVELNNVTATNIVILSGGTSSVILNNVTATNLTVKDDNSVRVQTIGTTAITNTSIQSGAILEATNGSFGAINLAPTSSAPITLRGNFGNSAINVTQPNTILDVEASAVVGTLTVNGSGTTVNNAGTIAEVVANVATEITGTPPVKVTEGSDVVISTTASNDAELKAALADNNVKLIKLTKSITMTIPVAPKSGVTIDGGNNTLTLNATSDLSNKTAEGLYIAQGVEGVSIKNLKVTRTGETNKDNLVEIYGNNTILENVEVYGGAKAGIYVNNDGEGILTVNFKDIRTSGNGWDAGIGLAAQKAGSKVVAKFTGTNSFAENVAVYNEGTTYAGTYEVTGLTGLTEVKVGKQQKWIENVPTVTVNSPTDGFVVGEATEFTITTTANNLAGVNVIGNSTHDFADAISKIEYLEVKDGKWYELPGDFGPQIGFPLTNATSTFRITCNKAGNFVFTTDIREASNKDNVLATVNANFVVKDATLEDVE